MRINYRFIPAHQLKAEHLPFLVMPERVSWVLKGYRSPDQIHQALPLYLQQRLSAYTLRDQVMYLSRLQEELKRGQWAVLSWQHQSKPVTAYQLRSSPLLAKKVAELQALPQSYRKANFAPVPDITPLPSSLTYEPVESMPEHKIVVEFAGQWGSNAASLSLGKTDSHEIATASPRSDPAAAHRSLARFKGLEVESRSLHINIPCKGIPPFS